MNTNLERPGAPSADWIAENVGDRKSDASQEKTAVTARERGKEIAELYKMVNNVLVKPYEDVFFVTTGTYVKIKQVFPFGSGCTSYYRPDALNPQGRSTRYDDHQCLHDDLDPVLDLLPESKRGTFFREIARKVASMFAARRYYPVFNRLDKDPGLNLMILTGVQKEAETVSEKPHFHETGVLEGGIPWGRLGAMTYILNAEGKPVTPGFHVIKRKGKGVYQASIGNPCPVMFRLTVLSEQEAAKLDYIVERSIAIYRRILECERAAEAEASAKGQGNK